MKHNAWSAHNHSLGKTKQATPEMYSFIASMMAKSCHPTIQTDTEFNEVKDEAMVRSSRIL